MKIKLLENLSPKKVPTATVTRELHKMIVKIITCGNFCKYGEEVLTR